MAASTEAINSSSVYIEMSTDGGTTYDKIGYAKDASLSSGMDARDISNKFSNGWRELAEGKRQWSLSGGGLVTYAVVAGEAMPNDLFDLLNGRTKVKVRFTPEATGDYQYTGDAYLTQYDQESSGEEDNVTFSFTFEGTGALAQAAKA